MQELAETTLTSLGRMVTGEEEAHWEDAELPEDHAELSSWL
jgi:hypothetical protein